MYIYVKFFNFFTYLMTIKLIKHNPVGREIESGKHICID